MQKRLAVSVVAGATLTLFSTMASSVNDIWQSGGWGQNCDAYVMCPGGGKIYCQAFALSFQRSECTAYIDLENRGWIDCRTYDDRGHQISTHTNNCI